jgi:hypothetical protein
LKDVKLSVKHHDIMIERIAQILESLSTLVSVEHLETLVDIASALRSLKLKRPELADETPRRDRHGRSIH